MESDSDKVYLCFEDTRRAKGYDLHKFGGSTGCVLIDAPGADGSANLQSIEQLLKVLPKPEVSAALVSIKRIPGSVSSWLHTKM